MVVLLAALMHAIWNSLISQANIKRLVHAGFAHLQRCSGCACFAGSRSSVRAELPVFVGFDFFTRLVHLHFDQGVCQEHFWPCLYRDAGDGASVRDDHLPAFAKRVIRHSFIFRVDIFDLRCFVSHERLPSQHHTIIKVGPN